MAASTESTGAALTGTIEAICVGAVGELDTGRRKIISAFVKTPVHGTVRVGPLGLPGDEHVYEHHGGPDMALLAYAKEHYAHWRALGLDPAISWKQFRRLNWLYFPN